MSVYRVIDKLEATVREGVWLPFGARIVSMDRLLDLVEKLRASLPDEVNRAKAVTKEKDRLLEDARYKAAAIVEEASTTKTQLLSDAEIVRLAQTKADELVSDAESRAREVRRGADEYAEQVLSSLDTSLASALAAVHKGREQLADSLSHNGSSTRARERK